MTISQTLIQQRQQEIEAEISKGHEQLQALEQRCHDIQNTLLRLSGAAQVLDEILAASAQTEQFTEPQTPNLAASR